MDPGKQSETLWWRNPFLWLPLFAAGLLFLVVLPLSAQGVFRRPMKAGVAVCLVAGAGLGIAMGLWSWWRLGRRGLDAAARLSYLPASALSPEERAGRRASKLRRRGLPLLFIAVSTAIALAIGGREGLALIGAELLASAACLVPQSLLLWRRARRLSEPPKSQ